jgi:hypothetical protein
LRGWARRDLKSLGDMPPKAHHDLLPLAQGWETLSDGDDAWISLRQTISARRFIDQRVAFAAGLMCRDVEDRAFLWQRVDNALGQKLADIGRWGAPEATILTGTETWRRRMCVVAVPQTAVTIAFGFTLQGHRGTVAAANLSFGVTDQPITALRTITAEVPDNLDLMAL